VPELMPQVDSPVKYPPSQGVNVKECSKCQGSGWIAHRGYRFYSDNGHVCPCGIYANVNEAAQAFQAQREQAAKEANEAYWAERARKRAERKARRQAGQA
jgi:hypothetical protein